MLLRNVTNVGNGMIRVELLDCASGLIVSNVIKDGTLMEYLKEQRECRR